ncbi:class I tRNA ligase family protein, partial [Staphylococcus aureus]|uniref:class I tRNA ligase family protein n=1 Tax=Staphylococcus aureus TaxID=1280 RepID=UPI0028CB8D71
MHYKQTLLIPKTHFPIPPPLPNNQPQIQQKSDPQHQYHKPLQKNKPNQTFILHHRPPYPDPNLHIPHPFNKILKHF